MLLTEDYCPFCSELADPSRFGVDFAEEWPFVSRVLFRNDRAFVVPGLGPQVYPYLLALTRRHTLSYATATDLERLSLISILDEILALQLFPSRVLSLFEHGGCSRRESAPCVDHAHIHVVDGHYDLLEAFAQIVPTAATAAISHTKSLPEAEAYIFVGQYDGSGEIGGLVASGTYPRQFGRRLLASLVGGEWNWRCHMNNDWVVRITAEVALKTGSPSRRMA